MDQRVNGLLGALNEIFINKTPFIITVLKLVLRYSVLEEGTVTELIFHILNSHTWPLHADKSQDSSSCPCSDDCQYLSSLLLIVSTKYPRSLSKHFAQHASLLSVTGYCNLCQCNWIQSLENCIFALSRECSKSETEEGTELLLRFLTEITDSCNEFNRQEFLNVNDEGTNEVGLCSCDPLANKQMVSGDPLANKQLKNIKFNREKT